MNDYMRYLYTMRYVLVACMLAVFVGLFLIEDADAAEHHKAIVTDIGTPAVQVNPEYAHITTNPTAVCTVYADGTMACID